MPYYLYCGLCDIDYDIITYLEQLAHEAPFVIRKLSGLDSSINKLSLHLEPDPKL